MVKKIEYKSTKQFSKLVCDYLSEDEDLYQLFEYKSNIESCKSHILAKKSFSKNKRDSLVDVLNKQYANFNTSKIVKQNISSLKEQDTYTVTTGHQLCLFTGPAYFIYKILDAIHLAQCLKKKYPEFNFVPIYWMASEDNDIEEISSLNVMGNKLDWDIQYEGISGEMPLDGLDKIYNKLEEIFPSNNVNSKKVLKIFKEAYLGKNNNLAEATFYLVNELFSRFGLVVLDANSAELKQYFKDVIKADIFSNDTLRLTQKPEEKLNQLGYKKQAYVREINFFHIKKGRNRIIKEGNDFRIESGDLLTENELETQIDTHPEYFSPNVILRPVYQETILPNIAYIGGGAELAYWGQLKNTFNHFNVPYPVLFLRNSIINLSLKEYKQLEKYQLSLIDIFLDKNNLIHQYLIKNTEIDLLLEEELKSLNSLMNKISSKVEKVDKTLLPYSEAREVEIKKKIEQIALKMRHVQKKKKENETNNILKIKDTILPYDNLQERFENFSTFYIRHGENWIDEILNLADVTTTQFQFNIQE